MYLNTSTGYVYKCTVAGAAAAAKWVYVCTIKGTAGTNATTTAVATQSANGLMSADDKKKLDGMAAGANAYTHPTTSGNKHIPSGGSSGQILRWSADGTAAWGADNNTTYSNMTAATASAAGKAGLVPAPAAGAQAKYLRGDGTWQTPPSAIPTVTKGTQIVLRTGKLSVTIPYATDGKTVVISLWRTSPSTGTYSFYGYDSISFKKSTSAMNTGSLLCGDVAVTCTLGTDGIVTLSTLNAVTVACEYCYQVIWYKGE